MKNISDVLERNLDRANSWYGPWRIPADDDELRNALRVVFRKCFLYQILAVWPQSIVLDDLDRAKNYFCEFTLEPLIRIFFYESVPTFNNTRRNIPDDTVIVVYGYHGDDRQHPRRSHLFSVYFAIYEPKLKGKGADGHDEFDLFAKVVYRGVLELPWIILDATNDEVQTWWISGKQWRYTPMGEEEFERRLDQLDGSGE